MNFIGRFASNNTIFASSYNDTTNKIGGTPLKVFVSTNESEYSPTGYEDYTNLIDDYYVKGFIEGLVGLKEGGSKTIGPIENAYGVYPKIGDVITVFDPSVGKEMKIRIVNITNNSAMPAEYQDMYGNVKTTLFVLRDDSYSLGEKTTSYPSWENATVVTAINETKMSMYTTPPEDQRENFTWFAIGNGGETQIMYWENASSITSMNDTTIIITHNPEIGAAMYVYDAYYDSTTTYYVENIKAETINISYYDANTVSYSYYEINRTITIVRNETQNITYTVPTEAMDQLLSDIKNSYDPNLILSVNKLAGESIIYEVQIVKIYKTS